MSVESRLSTPQSLVNIPSITVQPPSPRSSLKNCGELNKTGCTDVNHNSNPNSEFAQNAASTGTIDDGVVQEQRVCDNAVLSTVKDGSLNSTDKISLDYSDVSVNQCDGMSQKLVHEQPAIIANCDRKSNLHCDNDACSQSMDASQTSDDVSVPIRQNSLSQTSHVVDSGDNLSCNKQQDKPHKYQEGQGDDRMPHSVANKSNSLPLAVAHTMKNGHIDNTLGVRTNEVDTGQGRSSLSSGSLGAADFPERPVVRRRDSKKSVNSALAK